MTEIQIQKWLFGCFGLLIKSVHFKRHCILSEALKIENLENLTYYSV